MVDDLPETVRAWLIDVEGSGYVVWYRLDEIAVTILSIRHSKEAGYP